MLAKAVACVLVAIAMAPGLLLITASSDAVTPSTTAPAHAEDFLAEALADGAELFAWNCAVCHGASGGGLEEAKLAFPADHRDCTRCHRPSNRIVQPLDQPFNDHDMFAIGEPPALHALAGASNPTPLAAVAPPEALFAFLVSTMPRYDPGRLRSDEYRALTAFLLDLNGRHDEAGTFLSGDSQ